MARMAWVLLFLLGSCHHGHAWHVSRRQAVAAAVPWVVVHPLPSLAHAEFQTTASGRPEYTNAIAASRDTNISPAEAYDVLRQCIPHASTYTDTREHPVIVVDVGAGAGVSTALLYDKGYRCIQAVDWSATAWNDAVVQPIPDTMHFYQLDDATFFQHHVAPKSVTIIVYNFAINVEKATAIAQRYLRRDTNAFLLAPMNDTADYWYQQSYRMLDAQGAVTWHSGEADIGAWSVQFQPDVTATSCTGVWCGLSNGFLK